MAPALPELSLRQEVALLFGQRDQEFAAVPLPVEGVDYDVGVKKVNRHISGRSS